MDKDSRKLLDKRILEGLGARYEKDITSTCYRVGVSDNLTAVSWNGKISEGKFSLGSPRGEKITDFSVHRYKCPDGDSLASVRFYSTEKTSNVTDKQLGKLFFVLDRLIENSVGANLIGDVKQEIMLSGQSEYLMIGTVNSLYTIDLPQVHEALPPFSDGLTQDSTERFRSWGSGICKAIYQFEDGIANEVRGDIVGERLGYMDEKGNIGGMAPKDDSKLLEDFFARDLKFKEILANIKI